MRGKRNMCSRLRHRLILQQEVLTPDDGGGFSRSWEDVAQLWAEIQPIAGGGSRLDVSSGREIVAGEQVVGILSHRIMLRWRSGVTSAMRLVFEGRVFNIRYVAVAHEDKEMLELLVQEGVAD